MISTSKHSNFQCNTTVYLLWLSYVAENSDAYFLVSKTQCDDIHQIRLLNLILSCLFEIVKFLGAGTLYGYICVLFLPPPYHPPNRYFISFHLYTLCEFEFYLLRVFMNCNTAVMNSLLCVVRNCCILIIKS